MKINLKELKKNEFRPIVEGMGIGKLVYQLEETLDTLALNLQKKIMENVIPRGYIAVGIKSDEIKGLEYALKGINEHFGTDYESDPNKLHTYFNKPAQKSKN